MSASLASRNRLEAILEEVVYGLYEAVVEGGAQIVLAALLSHYRSLSICPVEEGRREKGLVANL